MFYAVMESPLGPLTLAATDAGLAAVHFGRTAPDGEDSGNAVSREEIGRAHV